MADASSPRFPTKLPPLSPSPITLTSVRGVRAAGVRAGIKASGAPDVAVLVTDEPFHAAAVFTQNKVAAAPVIVSREHLAQSGQRVRAIVVNSGNANACTGARGLEDARAMCAQVAKSVGCPEHEVLVCSTGVIGHKLPMDRVQRGIEEALGALSPEVAGGRAFLAAIQTTDAFQKEDGARFATEAGERVVAGICKGAGMIHPNMATLLAFMITDARIEPQHLSRELHSIAAQSFNAVHVDTHPSTNDTFVLLSASSGPVVGTSEWVEPASRVARRLAWLIARDGEGATKVTTITVRGASSDAAARAIVDHVATSALVRTALFGNDPNWGRFVSQVGSAKEVVSVAKLRCTLQGILVFENGEPTAFDRAEASKKMALEEDVALTFELGDGSGEAALMTSDLGYRYVEVNAEYTT